MVSGQISADIVEWLAADQKVSRADGQFGKKCHDGSGDGGGDSDGGGKSFHNRFYRLLECPLSPKLGLGLRL